MRSKNPSIDDTGQSPFRFQDRSYEMVSCLTEAAAPIKLIPARAPQERVYS